jgi:hypothetical protein
MRIFTALSIVICFTAAGQDRPQKGCSFEGFSADAKLAEVTRATVGYFGCGSAKDCLPAKLAAGDTVAPYHADGDWTCAYLQEHDGAGPGWVKSRDIREVPTDPAPPLDAWLGTWSNGRGRIRIEASKPAGKLHLAGDAESCTVELTLIGKYLVANDINRCGGMNVGQLWRLAILATRRLTPAPPRRARTSGGAGFRPPSRENYQTPRRVPLAWTT